jgi:hypothetical protein
MTKSMGMRWLDNVPWIGEMRNACKILVKKIEAKRPLVRPRHRWQDSIKMIPMKWGVDLFHIHQDKIPVTSAISSCVYCNESSGSIKVREFIS